MYDNAQTNSELVRKIVLVISLEYRRCVSSDNWWPVVQINSSEQQVSWSAFHFEERSLNLMQYLIFRNPKLCNLKSFAWKIISFNSLTFNIPDMENPDDKFVLCNYKEFYVCCCILLFHDFVLLKYLINFSFFNL